MSEKPEGKTVADDVLEAAEKAQKRDDGGPVYPIHFQHKIDPGEAIREQEWPGISLRDHYMGEIVKGLVAAHDRVDDDIGLPDPSWYASRARHIVNAMLRERLK